MEIWDAVCVIMISHAWGQTTITLSLPLDHLDLSDPRRGNIILLDEGLSATLLSANAQFACTLQTSFKKSNSFLSPFLPLPPPGYNSISTQHDFYLAYKGNKSIVFQESPTEVIKGIWNSRCSQNISRILQCTVCILQSFGQ